jgi:tetratricopeptide (TPR) repeat protein
MLTQFAATLTYLGHIDQARTHIGDALLGARRLGHSHSTAFVLCLVGLSELFAGSPDEAKRRCEEAIATTTEHDFPLWLGYALGWYGRHLITLGQAQESLAVLTRGLATVRATGALNVTNLILQFLAQAHATVGQLTEGMNCLAEAERLFETTDDGLTKAELYRVRGELLIAAGDQAGAEQSYRQALTVAACQSAKLWELRAATSLARLWRDQGKHAEARDLPAPVRHWFTEGFDTPVLREAKALLDELA